MSTATLVGQANREDPSVEERVGVAGGVPPLLRYWHIVLRWKFVIIGIVAAALIAGLVVTLLSTPLYTASSRVEIARENQNVTNVKGLESDQVGRDLEFYQTQYALLEARSLAERVVRVLALETETGFFEAHGVDPNDNALLGNSTRAPLSKKNRTRRAELAIGLLQTNISIVPIRGSALVDVRYTSASPVWSARIANAWSKQYIESSIARRFESTGDARKFLEDQLAQLKARVEVSERELVEYARAKDIVTLSSSEDADGRTKTERTLASENLETINDALAAATADRILAESQARQASRSGTSERSLANQAITALRQRRAEVASEYAKVLVQFEPGYPAARALERQVSALDASIAREEGRVASSIQTQYRQAVEREGTLKARVAQLQERLTDQRSNTIQLNIYQREADTNRELYDSLLQRYKEIGVAGVALTNIAIVDAAQIPAAPSSPNLPVNLVIALMAGVLLSGAAVVALEQVDEGIRSPEQLPSELGLPLLGGIPDVDKQNVLEQLRNPKTGLAESYLTVQSNLSFSTDHGIPASLLITSTRAAEGKSTTSLALAVLLGRSGKRVLLVDGDMRSPSMHKYVNTTNRGGLSNFLSGDDDWRQFLTSTEFLNLSILAAGPKPPSAAELLSGERLSELMTSLKKDFDHVVIDAPPVLGLADAPLLSRVVDGSIMVVEARGAPLRAIRAAVDRLQSVQAHLLGAVLTKISQSSAYGYGYGYGYGKDNDEGQND